MSSFLERILASRSAAIARAKANEPGAEVERRASERKPARDFRGALAANGMSLIGEFKRASPSRGELAPGLDPAATASSYERGGARALSVLTEPEFFKGSPDDLEAARAATSIPVLWKDFVIDPYQAALARSYDADAVLVIVRILNDAALRAVIGTIHAHEMCALVEVFDERDLERALSVGSDVIGVNHRDLETFEEDAEATKRLRPLIPDGVLVVGESAISTRADVEALEAIGVDAILVGEALVRTADPAAKVRELLGT